VCAQSRQTKRPSLYAIIGLKSMPAMQYGQRMVKVVSVSSGHSCTRSNQHWHANFHSRCQVMRWKTKGRSGHSERAAENTCAETSAGMPTARQITRATERVVKSSPAQKTKAPRPRLGSWDARRTALPRSLLITSLRSDVSRGNGSDGLLWKRVGVRDGRSLLGGSDPICGNLILLFAKLFSGTLSRQTLLHSALRARFQVEGVTLHFFNDVFRLYLALEPPQGILDRLTLLQSNFCQTHHPPTSPDRTKESLHHLRRGLENPASTNLADPAALRYFWHDLLIICTSVIVIWPCSGVSFFMWASWAASFASSFRLCAVAFLTTPVADTVCPT